MRNHCIEIRIVANELFASKFRGTASDNVHRYMWYDERSLLRTLRLQKNNINRSIEGNIRLLQQVGVLLDRLKNFGLMK